MASQEHLQQLMNDDSDDSTSSSSSSSNDEGNEEESAKSSAPAPTTTPRIKLPTSVHPKKRMKISLKSLPASAEIDVVKNEEEEEDEQSDTKRLPSIAASFPKVPARPRSQSPTPQGKRLNKRSLPIMKKKSSPPKKEAEIKATVVDSDDGAEDDVVATAIEDEPATATPVVSNEKSQQKKKSNVPNYRSFRLPPFSSPGLLVPINHSVTMITGKPNDDASTTPGLTTMSSVFDQYLTKMGYTEESRMKIPHIGSSVKREVGDMFDNNINFTDHFPKLVPEDLIPSASKDDVEDIDESRFALAKRLIRALKVKPSVPDMTSNKPQDESIGAENEKSSEAPRKRQKLMSWKDMAPLSLTLPYPESYVEKQLEYAEKVNKRELAILAYKQEVEALERENPELSEDGFNEEDDDETIKKPTTVVPPIPRPPSPPQLSELTGLDKSDFSDSTHPVYLPKSKELVEHLDKDCFHITNGRYFGLLSNAIADPNFVGPVAPGIPNLTASNSLATAQAGGMNMGNFPNNPSTVLPISTSKSSSSNNNNTTKNKSAGNASQSASISPTTTVKKKKKKPAIALPLRPMSMVKQTATSADTAN